MQSSQLVVKCITPLLSVFDCLGQADSVKYYMDIAEKELPELSPNAIEVLGFYEVKGELFNRYGQYRESLEGSEKDRKSARKESAYTARSALFPVCKQLLWLEGFYFCICVYEKGLSGKRFPVHAVRYKSNCLT